jgi:hypothetical protein
VFTVVTSVYFRMFVVELSFSTVEDKPFPPVVDIKNYKRCKSSSLQQVPGTSFY